MNKIIFNSISRGICNVVGILVLCSIFSIIRELFKIDNITYPVAILLLFTGCIVGDIIYEIA